MKEQMEPAKEIGSKITITERSQFLSISNKQAEQFKSVIIENQVIDDKISRKSLIFHQHVDELYFVNCTFLNDGEGILRECPSVKKVGFIRCNLSYDTLR